MKKIVVIGATGTLGKAVCEELHTQNAEVIPVARTQGTLTVDLTQIESVRALFKKIGPFDDLAICAGNVEFKPLTLLGDDEWRRSFDDKALGQIRAVRESLNTIRSNGSYTLISGVLSQTAIAAGTAATTINRAIEGFAFTASRELPRGIRINVVSPTVFEESFKDYGDFFLGFKPVPVREAARAYVRSIYGIETGQIYSVE